MRPALKISTTPTRRVLHIGLPEAPGSEPYIYIAACGVVVVDREALAVGMKEPGACGMRDGG